MTTLVKQPAESLDYYIDFTNLLASGDSLSSINTVTGTPTGLTIASTAISGTKVSMQISGGTDGTIYLVEANVDTTLGNTHEDGGYLFVTESLSGDTMSVSYDSLREVVGRMLGLDDTIADWTTAQADEVDAAINSGLRKFYWPKVPDQPQYEWTFLRRSGSISLVSGTSTYSLPADFGVMVGEPVIQDVVGGAVERIDITDLVAMQARRGVSGMPVFCAVRPSTHSGGIGTRYQLLVYPTPNAAETMVYVYSCEPEPLDDDNEYPLGGVVHGETIQEAVLSAVEQLKGDYEGVHTKAFGEQLAASIRIDQGQRP